MEITPAAIIDTIMGCLPLGELGQSLDAFAMSRLGPDAVLLDYGQGRAFVVTMDVRLGSISGHAVVEGN